MSTACSLAFEQGSGSYSVDDRLSIITGPIISAVAGYLILNFISHQQQEVAKETPI